MPYPSLKELHVRNELQALFAALWGYSPYDTSISLSEMKPTMENLRALALSMQDIQPEGRTTVLEPSLKRFQYDLLAWAEWYLYLIDNPSQSVYQDVQRQLEAFLHSSGALLDNFYDLFSFQYN